MKKLSTYLFLLLFSFQASSWANDISDFEIEGMSIGDSLLDYFSEEKIKKAKRNYYKDNEFSTFELVHFPESKIYDGLQALYKTKDKKYIIYSITGTLDCINDFTVCKKAWKKIVLDLVELFKDDAVINDRGTYNHPADESGKSKVTEIRFEFNSGDRVTVEMTDWSKKIGYYDNIRVNIDTKEIAEWLYNNTYK